jgi:hypothetical protein
MNRVRLVFWLGFTVVGLGVLCWLNAHEFATHWEPTNGGGMGGLTDPATESTYRTMGIVSTIFGLILLVGAALSWMNRKERESVDLPPEP